MYYEGEPEHHIHNVTSRIIILIAHKHMFHARVMNQTFKPCSWLVYESQVLDTTNSMPC